MTDEREGHLTPEQDKEVRKILLALHPFFLEAAEGGNTENLYLRLPPDLRAKCERLTEILGESGADIGSLLKLVGDDPE